MENRKRHHAAAFILSTTQKLLHYNIPLLHRERNIIKKLLSLYF